MKTPEDKKLFSDVKYPSWFLDQQQDFIANIVSQAYDLGHTTHTKQAKTFLRQHLQSRFKGEWAIRIVPSKQEKDFNDSYALKENGQPFYVSLNLNDTSYTMWKKG